MKKALYDYEEAIKRLPLKDKYTKDEILTEDFLIERDGNIEIYYAPHNEFINSNAKIFIVGITPGFNQMSTALATARKGFENKDSIEKIKYDCKVSGRFSGSLRKNMISMLDEIKLNKVLNLESCGELFGDKDNLLHSTALIPYPVFVKKANYTGHTPKLIKSSFLMNYVYDNFLYELKSLENFENILLIPLGKAVEEVLEKLQGEGVIKENQILKGFPHPSGANVNRIPQLNENKEKLINHIEEFFRNSLLN